MSISVSLSFLFSVFFFHSLSPLLLAGDKSRRGYRRLEGDVRTEQHAKSNPPAGLSLVSRSRIQSVSHFILMIWPGDRHMLQNCSELFELVLFVRVCMLDFGDV